MKKYLCRLIKHEEVAQGTLAIHLERPTDFHFTPGQSADLTLLDPPETDDDGNSRTFSMASAPFEETLLFATRLRGSAFKRVLQRLPADTPIRLAGPSGAFTLHRDPGTPAVLLAGGIGITPFLSMIKQALHERQARDLFLFYSNRRPEDAAFLQSLRDLAESSSSFHLIPTITDPTAQPSRWAGERGRIDAAMLSRHLPHIQGPMYYAAGPPAMVAAIRDLLGAMGIGEQAVRSEEFPGY